ncbi:Txe/YoeB family addiction module toxin [Olivibacter sp. SDN3]|uniref:Txe/YoeB family addiction module toxin n=1 Tax=unclassified Olivibacter TaxID=2632301 RepID=UPI0010666AB9|nr:MULTISPECIES: Txe/YoeB family addiction module toxin [unclassified Olivibacter]QNL48964.1 Txe/YoeB family addiction module toxin [Olivibacter sp. SDN3]
MEVIYTPQAVEDLNYWKKSGNKAIQKKIQQLILAIIENPFEGIGKPEPLKHQLSGSWSRRINREHRIVYEVYNDQTVVILEIQSLRGHYLK